MTKGKSINFQMIYGFSRVLTTAEGKSFYRQMQDTAFEDKRLSLSLQVAQRRNRALYLEMSFLLKWMKQPKNSVFIVDSTFTGINSREQLFPNSPFWRIFEAKRSYGHETRTKTKTIKIEQRPHLERLSGTIKRLIPNCQ